MIDMARRVLKSAAFLITVGVVSYSFAEQLPPPVVTTTSSSVTSSTPPPPFASSLPASPRAALKQGRFEEWLKTNGYPADQTVAPPPVPASPGQTLYYSQTETNRPSTPRAHPTAPSFAEEQQAMIESAPPGKFKPDADSTLAFNQLLKQNMPLAPGQVVQLRQQIDVAQRAAAIPANIPPKPVSSTLMINLAPGTTPPAVRLAQGYVSSLVFVDSTGSPWPIAAFDIGNPKAVNIQWDGKSNILIIQAVSPYSDGDIVVRLVGLPTPVTLELVSGQRVVDYRVDIHVSGIGPNAKDLPVGTPLPGTANQLLLGVLDGVAPPGSRTLSVTGADCEAWLLGEKMYLRTRLTVLSPGWMGKMMSPDGMQAYELPKTSSVLVSKFGEPAELKIEGF
jgi:intracellular multiplication protein IcmK